MTHFLDRLTNKERIRFKRGYVTNSVLDTLSLKSLVDKLSLFESHLDPEDRMIKKIKKKSLAYTGIR